MHPHRCKIYGEKRREMIISQITKRVAQDFFARFEHLGNCGLGVWHYGTFFNGQLVSAVSFGPTSFNLQRSYLANIANKYNCRIIQLTRGGTRFDARKNTSSKTLSLAFKEIRKRFGNTIVVAYSDTKWNEIGTIYQATNFLYLGKTNPKGQANYIINGRTMSGWTVRKKFHTRDMAKILEIDKNAKRLLLTPKHMYVYICAGKTIKRRVIKDLHGETKPYPKRSEMGVGSMKETWIAKNLLSG